MNFEHYDNIIAMHNISVNKNIGEMKKFPGNVMQLIVIDYIK